MDAKAEILNEPNCMMLVESGYSPHVKLEIGNGED
jgi:hypothetical protein